MKKIIAYFKGTLMINLYDEEGCILQNEYAKATFFDAFRDYSFIQEEEK